MKATVRALISVLALVVAGAVTAPAASARPVAAPATTAVMSAPVIAGAVVSVTPARIADSRTALQIPGPVGAVATAVVQLTGRGGIPGIGVAAVLATVTVVAPEQAGYITVWPSAAVRPDASNLNFQAGQTIANMVLIRVGDQGGIQLFNGSSGTVQLIVDVTGYVRSGTPSAAGAVAALTPARIVDSRVGRQIWGPVPALATEDMQIGGQGGIPLGGVAGVVATVTVADPEQAGFLTLWPSGDRQPDTSNLNFQAGQNIATTVMVPVSGDGALRVFNGSSGAVQVIVDVTGYTLSGTPAEAGTVVYPVQARIADSRSGLQIPGALYGRGALGLHLVAPGGGLSAAVLTVTVVDPQADGYLTVWPSGTGKPGSSNLNFRAGQNIATTVIVPVGSDGMIYLFNGSPGSAHLIVDFRGYTLPTPPAATGVVWAWGDGQDGQLGNGLQNDIWVPVRVSGLSTIVGIAGRGSTAYAVRGDGTVWAWGSGSDGALGNGGTTDSSMPVQVSGLTDITAIAAGGYTTGYALRSDGTVWAWGTNWGGQLGNGVDQPFSTVPVQVSGLTGVTAIAANGGANGYALLSDHTVWAWGFGGRGGLGTGSTADSTVPVQVSGLTGVTAIGGGGSGTGYAVRSDGTASAWGEGSWGQLGNSNIPGGPSSYSLVPLQVSGLTGVTAITGGQLTGYALRTDGTMWAWGSGPFGALGHGATTFSPVPIAVSGLTGVTAIAGGNYTGYALRTDGTVWAFGDLMGNGTTTGHGSPSPEPVPGLTGITAIASGGYSAYALTHQH